MVRMLYSLAGLALPAAGAVLAIGVSRWGGDIDPASDPILSGPGAVELFCLQSAEQGAATGNRTPPLLFQARILASYLNRTRPETVADVAPPPARRHGSSSPAPPRPARVSLKFKLHGTGYYPNHPDKSLALIWEPGGADGTRRWVKEGSQIGHFVVHEIRRGILVFRDGEQLHEVNVEREPSLRRLVRDNPGGAQKVSSALSGDTAALSACVGVDSLEADGGS